MVHANQHHEVQYHAYDTPEVLKMVSVDNQDPDDHKVRTNVKAVDLKPLEVRPLAGMPACGLLNSLNAYVVPLSGSVEDQLINFHAV